MANVMEEPTSPSTKSSRDEKASGFLDVTGKYLPNLLYIKNEYCSLETP